MTNYEKVGLFMTTFGQEIKKRPSLSTDKINNLRIKLIEEEVKEFKEAILKKDLKEAADALKLTAQHLKKIGVVDKVIKEPLGGAHRDKKKALEEVKKTLLEEITTFQKIGRQEIKKLRSEKYINMGSLSNL